MSYNGIPGPGKFESNKSLAVSELLYQIVQEGLQNEQFGSVEDSVWEALIINNEPNRCAKCHEKANTVPYSMAGQHHMYGPTDHDFIPTKPGYIVTEDMQGFFTYYEYETEEEAWSKYFADLAAYESHYANGEN